MMQKFAGSQTLSTLPMEVLSIRIGALTSPLSTDADAGWAVGLRPEQKEALNRTAASLHERFVYIENQHESAAENALQRAAELAENARRAAADEKQSKQRYRAGVVFLDDPTCDADYRNTAVVPSSEELLSEAPGALPRNLIHNSLGRSAEDGDDEDEEAAPVAHKGAAKVEPFRSVNHYLNTHFQLNREDCLAQLRRGIKAYRDKLADPDGKVSPPPRAKLQQVADSMSRSRGNDRVYIYEKVDVCSIEKAQEGMGYAVSFSVFGGGGRSIDWSRSSRFMNGSLLCLSSGRSLFKTTSSHLVLCNWYRAIVPDDWYWSYNPL
jgi:hypothetical protein